MELAYLQIGDLIEEGTWCNDCGQASGVLFAVWRLSASGVGRHGSIERCAICQRQRLYKNLPGL